MTSRDFCYWLQGYFEVNDAGLPKNTNVDAGLIGERVKEIKRHLAMVFVHEIDPTFGGPEKQEQLNHIHNGGKQNGTPRC